MMRLTVIALSAVVASPAIAQQGYSPLDSLAPPAALAAPVSLRVSSVPLRTAIADVARQANASIAFDPALAGVDRPVSATFERVPAARALLRLLGGSDVQAMVSSSGSIVLTLRSASGQAAREKKESTREIVAGIIRQPDGPLGGVHVWLAGTRFETMTDQGGRFSFGSVPAGSYLLRALRLGFAPIAQLLRVGGGPIGEMRIDMIPAAVPVAAVIVTPGYIGVMQPGLASGQALTRQQIETVPQLGEDVYRTIGRLPGVATDEFSAKFSLRGESSDALYTTLDGLPLIEPYHLRDIGSALSIVDLASLGQAELIAGGPSAEYGNEIAGAFRLHSVEPRTDRARTSLGLSISNLRAMSQGGFADGKGAWLLSARRGFLDLVFKISNIQDSIRPTYDDVLGKLTYQLGPTTVGVHVLHAGDRLVYLDRNDPSIDSRYRSDYAWLTAEGRVGSALRQESVAWVDALDWRRHGYSLPAANETGDIADQRSIHLVGARQDWSAELGSRLLLKFGGEATHSRARFDYARTWSRYESSSGNVVRNTDTVAVNIAPDDDRLAAYVSQRVRPVASLTLEAGARYDRSSATGDAFASPRFNGAWQPLSGTTMRASYGEHAQSQPIFSLHVENGVRDLQPAERARQLSVGIDQAIGNGVTLRAEAYDRRVSDPWSEYVTASMQVVPIQEIDRHLAFIAPTRARAKGVELTVEREAGRRMDWSASYVISSSKMQLEGAWVPRPIDQPRAARADWSFHPASNTWRISVSGVRHTGWPFTPEAILVDTVQSGKNTSLWFFRSPGKLYSERAAAYQRIDARWTKFVDTPSGRFSVFVDVYNLLNNSNERDRYKNVFFTGQTVHLTDGSRVSLPRIPSFGINWEF